MTDRDDPSRIIPNTLTQLPIRQKLRALKAEPRLKQSNMESIDPRRTEPYADNDEPARMKLRIDTDDPTEAKSRIESEDPNLFIP
jgi:hypothetical protein